MVSDDVEAKHYPLLPLEHTVIFPHNVTTLLLARPRSIQAVEAAVAGDRRLVVVAYRTSADVDGTLRSEALHAVGTLAEVVQLDDQEDAASHKVVLEGLSRVRIVAVRTVGDAGTVVADELSEGDAPVAATTSSMQVAWYLAERYATIGGRFDPDVRAAIRRADRQGQLADLLATQMISDLARRQELLELLDPEARLERVIDALAAEVAVAERATEQIAMALAALDKAEATGQVVRAIENRLSGLEERVARLEGSRDGPVSPRNGAS